MGRRRDVEADDIGELLHERLVVRELELPPAMGAETVGLPDALHRGRRDPCGLRHCPQGPVCRLMRRRCLGQAHDLGHALRQDRLLARRSRGIVQEAIDAFMHIPLLPAPDAGLRLAAPSHDPRRAEAVIRQKDDLRPPDVFLCRLRGRDDHFKPLTVRRRDCNGYSPSHDADSHRPERKGIQNRTPLFRSIH